MMKLFSRLMLVLALGVTSPAYASQDGEVTLKLIETSDVHDAISPMTLQV